MHVVGIDAGGTKTVALLADASGQIVGSARGPGANLQSAGELAVEKVIHQVMTEALGGRSLVPSAICLGMAGVDRDQDKHVVVGILRRIGATARLLVVNDALIALEAGVGGHPGIVIVAGTGSIAYGRNERGEAARAGGWGYVLGDEGSGYWMGRRALRAVVRAADRRGPPTALSPRILAHFEVERPDDLVHEVYFQTLSPQAIAALARSVHEAAEEGDYVAGQIIDLGARELMAAAVSVAERLDLVRAPITVLLAGGLFVAVPRLEDRLTASARAILPEARVRRLAIDPAEGAVRLALAEAGGGARLPSYIRAAAPSP
jgi:N-acetylglucosamine kinase-like BadF-type ATPase